MRSAGDVMVQFLGVAGGVPRRDSPCSGYLVRSATTSILLDCGPGIAGCFEATDRLIDLDGVIISHLHLDHCYDLLPLGYIRYGYQQLAAREGRTVAPLPLYLPEGGRELLETLNGCFPVPTVQGLDRMFDLVYAAQPAPMETPFEVGDALVRRVPMRHAIPCGGVRIELEGRVIAYTGDTGPTERITELAVDADLLLIEASFLEPGMQDHGHLSAAQAGEAARAAGVDQLVVTHQIGPPLGPPIDRQRTMAAAARAFGGPVTVARAGERVFLERAEHVRSPR